MGAVRSTPWAAAAQVASDQWGLATVAQLAACGCTARMVGRATAAGRLVRVHRGVYALGIAPATPHARAMAAVLAAGPGALLSHRWALWLWDLGRLPSGAVHVSAPTSRRGGAGYVLHRVRDLAPDHTYGIPLTTPARTIADCAPSLTGRQLRRAVNQAQILHLTQPEALRAQPRLRSLVSAHGATRSLLEDLLCELDLPEPSVNVMVHGVEVDFHYPDLHLVVEADGWAFHRTRIAFEDDHERRLHLEANGERVVAVTWAQVRRRDQTVARLRAIVAAQSASSSSVSSAIES